MEKEQSSGVFTPEESKQLTDLQDLRKRLITSLLGGDLEKIEVPKSGPDKILLGQMIDGTERQITSQAKLRLAAKDSANQQDYRKMVAETFRSYAMRRAQNPVTPAERELPIGITADVVPGECDIGHLPLDAQPFLDKMNAED